MNRIFYSLLASILLAGLTACGGDSAGTSTVSGTVSGTAATGVAIAGATVQLKCADGSTTTGAQTTGTDGKFSITVTNVVLPCLAQLTDNSTVPPTVLHSYVGALGTTNISPITEMVVGSLLGSTPTATFSAFDPAKIASISDIKVQAAIATVKTKLQGLGVDVSKYGDPIKDLLVTPQGGTQSDLDKILDDLKAKRTTAGKSVDQLTGELVADSPNKGTTGNTGGTGGNTGASTGYPTAGTYTGKTADNSACSITVGADHSVSASVAGQTLSTTLDGFYFDSTNSEIYLMVFYTGTSRFYESNGTTTYDAASTATPYYNIGLSFDATSGKFIMAHGQKTTDSSMNPVAGKNFTFVCAGEAYPSGTPIGSSGFNTAAASRFAATNLVGGPYTAPTSNNTACTFEVDTTGNATVTWSGFSTTGGKLVLPYDRLTTTSDQSVNQAKYEVYYDKTSGKLLGSNSNGSTILNAGDTNNSDWFLATLSKDTSGNKIATVMANGASNNAKSVTCSTANDPAAKWSKVAAYAGTWVGVRNTNSAFGTAATCKLVVSANGSMVYTDTNNTNTSIDSTGWTVTPPSAVNSAYFDFAKNGTNITFSMDFSGTSIVSGPSQGKPEAFYWKSGASTEYCDKMVKQ